ncbi:uncharacterized protein LOC132264673 [Phlebotomus argentipes]|uniref:uncharacterized protein LOC132264673 n=1 Tax=Phlebotomus argentipes TaxID=94469 RepID=UPI0028934283|nr:uncharacterized protein LOC132264673 [Phlebotomus argentipes]
MPSMALDFLLFDPRLLPATDILSQYKKPHFASRFKQTLSVSLYCPFGKFISTVWQEEKMERIFYIFFEELCLQLNRDGLQTRHSRKNARDHLNSIISGICDGQNLAPEESARLAVETAIHFHRDEKAKNSQICLMGTFHNILYIALKASWDWSVTDSSVVCSLLGEIYSCERTFERLFLGAIFGTSAPYFIAGWKSDFRDQDENSRAMVYFLEHASRRRIEFPVHAGEQNNPRMTRFIDVPIESCGMASPLRVTLQAGAPDILLILLRYGANPNPTDGGSSAIIALLDKLLESKDRRYPYQLEACLKILMRAVPFIDLPFKPYTFDVRKEVFMTKYWTLIKDGLLTDDQIGGVSLLKHLARCAIRQRLRETGKLPSGIKTFGLPRHLRRYIDLMED